MSLMNEKDRLKFIEALHRLIRIPNANWIGQILGN